MSFGAVHSKATCRKCRRQYEAAADDPIPGICDECLDRDVPEAQHQLMRAMQGREFVEQAAGRLYFCALKCQADGVPWPKDLDEAHAILCRHLGVDEELRRQLVGEPG